MSGPWRLTDGDINDDSTVNFGDFPMMGEDRLDPTY